MNGNRRRVVVTGLGLVTPLGVGVERNWESLVAGRSGIRVITRFDASQLPTRIGGEVPDFDPAQFIEHKELKKMDDFIRYAIAAARLANDDAGLPSPLPDPERTGVIVGVGMGGIGSVEDSFAALERREIRKVTPFFIPRIVPNMAAGHVAMLLGAQGINYAAASACSSGAHAVGEAAIMIRDGRQDVMIAGGCEAPVCLLGVGGFNAMRALATSWNDDPTRASRPFDVKREGFVIAEGAAMLVLETLAHATARGARIYGEVLGYGASCDAYHITQPAPEGIGAARCMTLALADAQVEPTRVGYVNAHGTGTTFNDVAETQALKTTFGAHAARLAVSSTKSMTGHTLGAAGAIESAFTLLAIARGVLPPTINLDEPDPACDLDYVPRVAREARVDVAISNSFGFGGTNATLVFGRIG